MQFSSVYIYNSQLTRHKCVMFLDEEDDRPSRETPTPTAHFRLVVAGLQSSASCSSEKHPALTTLENLIGESASHLSGVTTRIYDVIKTWIGYEIDGNTDPIVHPVDEMEKIFKSCRCDWFEALKVLRNIPSTNRVIESTYENWVAAFQMRDENDLQLQICLENYYMGSGLGQGFEIANVGVGRSLLEIVVFLLFGKFEKGAVEIIHVLVLYKFVHHINSYRACTSSTADSAAKNKDLQLFQNMLKFEDLVTHVSGNQPATICMIMLAHVLSANILVNVPFRTTRRSGDVYDMHCNLFGYQRESVDRQFHLIFTAEGVKPIKQYMFDVGDSITHLSESPRRADKEFLLADMAPSSTAETQHLALGQQTTALEAILVSRLFVFNYTLDDLPCLFLLKNTTLKPIIENYSTGYSITTKFISGIGFCEFSVLGAGDNTSHSLHR